MRRWLLLLVIVAPELLHGQAPDPKPLAFEVASVKPSSGPAGIGRVSPDRFLRPDTTVLILVTYAYAVDGVQVDGGDPWMRESRFHLDAKAEGRPTEEQMRAMVRQLLAERFHLKTHVETRDLPRYAMVKARGD